MSDIRQTQDAGGPTQRAVELGLAALMAVFGLIVMLGSYKVGIGWAIEGPRSGFFPFWIGAMVVAASAVNMGRAFVSGRHRQFSKWGQMRQVALVVAPTAVFVMLVPWIGIYIAGMILIGVFMARFGGYGLNMVLPVAIGVPAIFYVVFERYFLVPLPKGPVEYFLDGYMPAILWHPQTYFFGT